MKTSSRLSHLAIAAILFTAGQAHAYFDPHIGRWASRDPINELGFKALTRNTESFATNEEKNVYCFVGNAPLHKFDYLGLVGKVCVEKCCSAKALENFRYIPENIPAGVPCYLAWPLKPGQ